ncbi:MAG: 16S rRNA pseudouridine(516) synthase RsuA [Candidatus Thiodiazotropha sp.]
MTSVKAVIRIDRFISNATALSRSQVQRVIRAGRVRIDGVQIKKASTPVSLDAEVYLDESMVAPPMPRYFMLNKPIGVVSASHDPSHRTVLDLIDVPRRDALHIVGRLDIDTSGLVLVTDDGQWSHRITAPSKRCRKCYRVALAEPLGDQQATRLAAGLLLRGESKPTRPAVIERLSESELRLTVTEGRYHQVKRMFAALGNHVVALHRESIGELHLDHSLEPGAYRPLLPQEIALF